MAETIRVRGMDGSLGVTLPREIADRMHIREGDVLYAVETESGLLLTSYGLALERPVQLYQRGARKYRDALRELAD